MWPNLLNMFKGKAGGAEMTPYKNLKAEELEAWEGYDPASEKSRHTQYANAAAQQQSQQSTMFGQLGDPGKAMGTVWDQLKGAGGKLKEGIQGLDRRMEENYAASGWAPEGYKSPYDKSVPGKEELDYTSTGQDIDESGIPNQEAVDKVVASQQTPEGQMFKEHMNQYQDEGNYASGAGLNQSMGGMGGGMLGGYLNKWLQKPWDYQVQSKHRYQGNKR